MKSKLFVRPSKDRQSIIILDGSFFLAKNESEAAYRELNEFIDSKIHYIVKQKGHRPTYIYKDGEAYRYGNLLESFNELNNKSVYSRNNIPINRYGVILAKKPMNFVDSIEFPKGVFRLECLMSLEQIKEYLQ